MKYKQITICWRIKQKMCAKVWPKENRNVAETWQIIFDFGRCWQNVFILNLFGRNNSQFCELIIRTIANSQFAKPLSKSVWRGAEAEVQKCTTFVHLKKCRKISIHFQESTSIQPRTYPPNKVEKSALHFALKVT